MSSNKPEAFAEKIESANFIFIVQMRFRALRAMGTATATAMESALFH
jgi:hypothetical protein